MCVLCDNLCPYNNTIDFTQPTVIKPYIILTEKFSIIPPCDNINKNFFGIKNREPYTYYNHMEVPYLINAIEFIINEQDTSLEDTLKLTKIKSQLQ